MQCAEYQEGIWVVNGIMAMLQQDHLHNVITYLLQCKQPKKKTESNYTQPPPLRPQKKKTPAIHQRSPSHPLNFCCWHVLASPPSWVHDPTTSFNHPFDILQKSQIFSSLIMSCQLLMAAADSRCFMEGEINWQVNVVDWNIMRFMEYNIQLLSS